MRRHRPSDERVVKPDTPKSPPVEPLARYVEVEARRTFFEHGASADPELIAAGWERRFITDIRRVSEVIELYERLGFETRAESLRPEDLADDCQDCQLATLGFRSVYTRRMDTSRVNEPSGGGS